MKWVNFIRLISLSHSLSFNPIADKPEYYTYTWDVIRLPVTVLHYLYTITTWELPSIHGFRYGIIIISIERSHFVVLREKHFFFFFNTPLIVCILPSFRILDNIYIYSILYRGGNSQWSWLLLANLNIWRANEFYDIIITSYSCTQMTYGK